MSFTNPDKIRQYVKRPIAIVAIQWTGNNWTDVRDFISGHYTGINRKIFIHTLEGDMEASAGDFIIKGIKGEFYPCKPDIFEASYEEVI